MGYVDMRDRQGGRHRAAAGTSGPGREDREVHRLLAVGALALGIPIAMLSVLFGLPIVLAPVALALCAVGTVSLVKEYEQPRPPNPRRGRGLGSEKQLLLALRESGGLTAVEAALETSLTVDEAEGILSRLAERGHLRVESRDGALSYALPGGHAAGVAGPLKETEGRTS